MADIRDSSGVSMRRLYSLYPSKSDLVSAWLKHRHHEWLNEFRATVGRHIGASKNAIDAVFLALEDWMTKTGFTGCGFINTHAERSELSDEHRDIIAMHKRAVANYLEELTGSGPAIALLVDGAIVEASIFGHAGPIHTANSIAERL
jgi:AcrR family transcriptional regulator